MIIGISGFKGAGKDTAADIFVKYGFVKISSASPLKDIVSILFSWNREMLEGVTEESRIWREKPDPKWQWLSGQGIFKDDKYISPRCVLQRIGTDLYRNHIHQDIWCFCLRQRMESIKQEYKSKGIDIKGFIIPDARFINELSICNQTLLIIRSEHSQKEIENMPESEKQHLHHKFDHIVYNKGSLSDLHHAVDNIMHRLFPSYII